MPARGRLHQQGVGFVPADRHRFGLVLSFPAHRQPRAERLLPRALRARARSRRRRDRACTPSGVIAEYDIRTPSANVTAGTLSGGNQQKVVVAREFDGELCVSSSSTSRRAASTSAASSSSTGRPSRSATPAWPCCSSPPSSTRCSSCRTGSGSCTAAGSWRSSMRRSTNREEVGLLMATGGRDEPPPVDSGGRVMTEPPATVERPAQPPRCGAAPRDALDAAPAGHGDRAGAAGRRGDHDRVEPARARRARTSACR